MRPQNALRTALLGLVVVLAGSMAPARADFIASLTTSVTQFNASTYFYSYTLAVAANSTSAASEFDLALNAPILSNSIVMPTNFFSFYTSGDPFITFTAYDNGTPFVGIAPGSSGTFSFYSNYAPMMFAYQATSLNADFTTSMISGMTLAPSVVPEPSSLLLSGLGLCGALGLVARSRRAAMTAG